MRLCSWIWTPTQSNMPQTHSSQCSRRKPSLSLCVSICVVLKLLANVTCIVISTDCPRAVALYTWTECAMCILDQFDKHARCIYTIDMYIDMVWVAAVCLVCMVLWTRRWWWWWRWWSRSRPVMNDSTMWFLLLPGVQRDALKSWFDL